jgi:dGTP triphosphohydrolase
LTHESILVSIPDLTAKRRNELEKILSIFDQSNRSENFHILNVKEEEFPEKYKEILRRLQKAASEPEMRKKMSTEDDIMEQFNDLEELLEKKEIELEEERKLREEKERMVEEEKRQKEEERKQKEEERKLREEKEKALEQALKELEELKKKMK